MDFKEYSIKYVFIGSSHSSGTGIPHRVDSSVSKGEYHSKLEAYISFAFAEVFNITNITLMTMTTTKDHESKLQQKIDLVIQMGVRGSRPNSDGFKKSLLEYTFYDQSLEDVTCLTYSDYIELATNFDAVDT